MLTQFDDARPAEKVKAAYEALDRIVGDSRSEEALSQTEEFQKAVQQLQETHNTLNPPKKPAAAAAPKDGAVAQVLDKAKTVAVFGSSSAKPGSPEYKAAFWRLARDSRSVRSRFSREATAGSWKPRAKGLQRLRALSSPACWFPRCFLKGRTETIFLRAKLRRNRSKAALPPW